MNAVELTKALENEIFAPYFKDAVTLDPARVEELWDKLNEDTSLVYLSELNKVFAYALLQTLVKQGVLNDATRTEKGQKAKTDGNRESA